MHFMLKSTVFQQNINCNATFCVGLKYEWWMSSNILFSERKCVMTGYWVSSWIVICSLQILQCILGVMSMQFLLSVSIFNTILFTEGLTSVCNIECLCYVSEKKQIFSLVWINQGSLHFYCLPEVLMHGWGQTYCWVPFVGHKV